MSADDVGDDARVEVILKHAAVLQHEQTYLLVRGHRVAVDVHAHACEYVAFHCEGTDARRSSQADGPIAPPWGSP